MMRIALALLAAVTAVPAAGVEFDPQLDLRYRYENVDQDGFAENAEASTLRTRLGIGFALYEGWQGLVEFEDVRVMGIDDYNSTANGRTEFPVSADPEDTELNQAWMAWRPNESAALKLGRQRIILDNARFVGNVGFRQNEQTFDAGWFSYRFDGGVALYVSHLEKVNRIFGDNHPNPLLAETDVNAELINLSWQGRGMQLVGYVYLLENEDVPSASTETYGLRWTGGREFVAGSLRGALEYATQDPYEDGAAVNEADYWLVKVGFHGDRVGLDLAQETLEGNGAYGFSTPLATLHAFQGWADVFLGTPVDGVEDRYARLSGSHGQLKWQAVYHDFDAERTNADYGSELDLSVSHPLAWELAGKLEYADYDSDGFGADTRKLWFTLERCW